MATSRFEDVGSFTKPVKITLTLKRDDLKTIAEGGFIEWNGFKLRGGLRMNLKLDAEPRTE